MSWGSIMAILSLAAADGRPASPYPTIPASVSIRIRQPSPKLSRPIVLTEVILTIFDAVAARARKSVSHDAAGIASAHCNKSRRLSFMLFTILPDRVAAGKPGAYTDATRIWARYAFRKMGTR